jgi:hypothetical protein
MMHRRSFLLGLGALMAAPAIVKATSLMPVKQMIVEPRWRMISGSLDPTTRTVRWHYKSGEFTQWIDEALCKLDEKDLAYAEQHDDYFKQVDQAIKSAGENPDGVPIVLGFGAHEPNLDERFAISREAIKDLQFVSDFSPNAKVIAERPWDLRASIEANKIYNSYRSINDPAYFMYDQKYAEDGIVYDAATAQKDYEQLKAKYPNGS